MGDSLSPDIEMTSSAFYFDAKQNPDDSSNDDQERMRFPLPTAATVDDMISMLPVTVSVGIKSRKLLYVCPPQPDGFWHTRITTDHGAARRTHFMPRHWRYEVVSRIMEFLFYIVVCGAIPFFLLLLSILLYRSGKSVTEEFKNITLGGGSP